MIEFKLEGTLLRSPVIGDIQLRPDQVESVTRYFAAVGTIKDLIEGGDLVKATLLVDAFQKEYGGDDTHTRALRWEILEARM